MSSGVTWPTLTSDAIRLFDRIRVGSFKYEYWTFLWIRPFGSSLQCCATTPVGVSQRRCADPIGPFLRSIGRGSAAGENPGPLEVEKSFFLISKTSTSRARSHVRKPKLFSLAERRVCSAEFNPGSERTAADLTLVLVGGRRIGALSEAG